MPWIRCPKFNVFEHLSSCICHSSSNFSINCDNILVDLRFSIPCLSDLNICVLVSWQATIIVAVVSFCSQCCTNVQFSGFRREPNSRNSISIILRISTNCCVNNVCPRLLKRFSWEYVEREIPLSP